MNISVPSVPRGVGVGVDVVDIARLENLLSRYPDLAEALFTGDELATCAGQASRLAARWAAKEAIAKVLGGLGTFDFHDVVVSHDSVGRPLLRLFGRAADQAANRGLAQWDISLSHDGNYAAAVVVAWASP